MRMSIICGLISLLFTVRTKGFSMQGPAAGSIVAQLGGSVLLPCSVDRPLALEELEVEWKRTDSQTLVHLFQEGQSRPESQPARYRDRATFFSDLIPKGNFSLLLSNVSTEDTGVYGCGVHTDLESNNISMKMYVEQLVVTGPDQAILVRAGEEVIMKCSVDTHVSLKELQVEWQKTDQNIMVLLFSDGESRPESQHERYHGRAQFFPEEVQRGNFSLKLKNVRTEDKGEYTCNVHTESQSANVSARLLEVGFSSLHLSVLVFSISAPCVALLTSVPALLCIMKRDGSNRAMLLYGFHSLVPCIMNFCAFVLWGVTEGFLPEAFTCSAINLLRILLLLKMAPYLNLIPDNLCVLIVKKKTVYIEIIVITMGTLSVFLWEYLENRSPTIWGLFGIGLGYGFGVLPCIVALLSSGTTGSYSFEMLAIGIPVQILSLGQMMSSELKIENFAAISVTTLAVLALSFMKPCLMLWKKCAYESLLCIIFLLQIAAVFRHLDMIKDKNEEIPAVMSATAYLYILTAVSSFQHRTNLPAIPHILVYMFGATGLTAVSSVTVAVELFQKARKGQRTVKDLQIILLSFESPFVVGWLTLQIFAYCMEKKIKAPFGHWNGTQRGNDDPDSLQRLEVSHDLHEMERLSPRDQRGSVIQKESETEIHIE